jgi:hypothetical protein
MPSTRIRINPRPYANHHASPNERIVEFSSPSGGGLISFREVDGGLEVEVYRHDDTVSVLGGMPVGAEQA